MSQEELGSACGVSFQQIQKLEKAVNRVSVARLQQIAAALETPMSYFHPPEEVTGQEDSQPSFHGSEILSSASARLLCP